MEPFSIATNRIGLARIRDAIRHRWSLYKGTAVFALAMTTTAACGNDDYVNPAIEALQVGLDDRPCLVEYRATPGSAEPTKTVSYEYDDDGRVVRVKEQGPKPLERNLAYDRQGRLVNETQVGHVTFDRSYRYEGAQLVLAAQVGAETFEREFEYDKNSQLVFERQAGTNAYTRKYVRRDGGKLYASEESSDDGAFSRYREFDKQGRVVTERPEPQADAAQFGEYITSPGMHDEYVTYTYDCT